MRRSWGIVCCALLFTLLMAGSAAAVEADDNIPGVQLPPPPFVGTLNEATDWSDVYAIALEGGDSLSVLLAAGPGATGDQDYDLYLYGPSATNVDYDTPVAASELEASQEAINYTAPFTGTYYIEVYNFSGSGGYQLNYAYQPLVPRVHRFYNARLGTHFYTANEGEKNNVMRTLGGTYSYEGVAYRVNNWPTNPDYLHRFLRPSTGTHFYTADPDEKYRVQTTMGSVYTYEGIGYAVSRGSGGGSFPTIWRFFNRTNGTHFYTADGSEMARVRDTLGYIYTYDGPAFYLAQ